MMLFQALIIIHFSFCCLQPWVGSSDCSVILIVMETGTLSMEENGGVVVLEISVVRLP